MFGFGLVFGFGPRPSLDSTAGMVSMMVSIRVRASLMCKAQECISFADGNQMVCTMVVVRDSVRAQLWLGLGV